MATLFLRFTSAERHHLERCARREFRRNLTDYCRACLVRALVDESLAPKHVVTRQRGGGASKPVKVTLAQAAKDELAARAVVYAGGPEQWRGDVAPYCRGLVLAVAKREVG